MKISNQAKVSAIKVVRNLTSISGLGNELELIDEKTLNLIQDMVASEIQEAINKAVLERVELTIKGVNNGRI